MSLLNSLIEVIKTDFLDTLLMVKMMVKNNSSKKKCAEIDICDDLAMLDNLSNPYGYNFGKIEKFSNREGVARLQNRVNPEFFYKR